VPFPPSLRISPLVNNDRKGGAFPIMLHQFRRAIGVAIVRGNAQHKLSRLHYVRATPEEAADACSANHSSNRWESHRHGQSNWFSQHKPDGYGTYEQFRRPVPEPGDLRRAGLSQSWPEPVPRRFLREYPPANLPRHNAELARPSSVRRCADRREIPCTEGAN
ncbi:hypothetical protein THAOC_13894, partial [Thalassiosira oceanica]